MKSFTLENIFGLGFSFCFMYMLHVKGEYCDVVM